MNRLRELRESRSLSRAKVASDLGISRQGYGYYESGQRTPSVKVLKQLADYFNVSPDFILNENFNLQLFSSTEESKPKPKVSQSEMLVANSIGHILTLKDEQSKKLTLQIMEDVLHLTIPQLEALSALIKTIK